MDGMYLLVHRIPWARCARLFPSLSKQTNERKPTIYKHAGIRIRRPPGRRTSKRALGRFWRGRMQRSRSGRRSKAKCIISISTRSMRRVFDLITTGWVCWVCVLFVSGYIHTYIQCGAICGHLSYLLSICRFFGTLILHVVSTYVCTYVCRCEITLLSHDE